MTRIQSAERAVVEAAIASAILVEQRIREMGPTPSAKMGPEGIRVIDACSRLRDLREQARAEECGERSIPLLSSPWKDTRCHLRGHEGEHEGNLGVWRWS